MTSALIDIHLLRLWTPLFTDLPLVVDATDLPLLLDLADRLDNLADLVADGRVVTIGADDPVQLLEGAATAVRVRVVAGPRSGRSGWVPSAWVRHGFASRRALAA